MTPQTTTGLIASAVLGHKRAIPLPRGVVGAPPVKTRFTLACFLPVPVNTPLQGRGVLPLDTAFVEQTSQGQDHHRLTIAPEKVYCHVDDYQDYQAASRSHKSHKIIGTLITCLVSDGPLAGGLEDGNFPGDSFLAGGSAL